MTHSAWWEQAENDLAAARVLSAQGHHSQAVWLSSQAVEKAHKAILLALGLRYEDRHFKHLSHNTVEISKLLPAALHEPSDPQIAEMIASLERRAASARYPAPQPTETGQVLIRAPAVSITQSQDDIRGAERLLAWCRERLARAERAAKALASPSP